MILWQLLTILTSHFNSLNWVLRMEKNFLASKSPISDTEDHQTSYSIDTRALSHG